MNFRHLSDANLANFASNILTLLGGTELDAIDEHVRTDLVTAFGTLPAQLATATATAAVAKDAAKSVVSDKNDIREATIDVIGAVAGQLRAVRASKGQFDACGFGYPFGPRATIVPETPFGLAAYGYSNGVNRVEFTGNNGKRSVKYEIWRRQGDTGDWNLIAAISRQSYTDEPVTPGQYYEYKVRASAAKSVSEFSNSAVVYGVA